MSESDIEVIDTPQSAIQQSIFDLIHECNEWKDKHDPNGVRPWMQTRIKQLHEAQRQLEELRAIKHALAVLKSSVI